MRSLNDYFMTVVIAQAASTAGQVVLPCPDGGRIKGIFTNTAEAIAGADSDFTIKVVTSDGGTQTAMTNGTHTAALTSALAFRTESSEFTTGDGTEAVPTGGGIEIEWDNGNTNAMEIVITLIIRR